MIVVFRRRDLATERSILLVEDNQIVQKFTKGCFEREGCQVTSVGTKNGAIELVKEHCFSLILLDIGLPDGSGFEVMEFARADGDSKNITTPIVVISAHINEEKEKEKFYRWRVNTVIEKPFRYEKVVEILSRN